ncbi:MAG TPA: hypothetical protein V6D10_09575 [Trichocoleus sp.]|jgi:hypothetical protein
MTDFTHAAHSTRYRVSVWETIAITSGAILLVAIGLAGLGIKALGNAFDPRRAEAIARSIATYSMPGGSKGMFGANFGGGKLAVITSNSLTEMPANMLPPGTTPPAQVELLIARIPVTEAANVPRSDETETDVQNELFLSGFSFSYQAPEAFQVNATHTENKSFCGAIVPVIIQEGTLTPVVGVSPIPAVRYQADVKLSEDTRVAIVSAVGADAQTRAATVFNSLRCN